MYYYIAQNQQQGPVDENQLKALIASGAILGHTLVWGAEISEWMPISKTSFASGLAAPTPILVSSLSTPTNPPPLPSPSRILVPNRGFVDFKMERVRHPSEKAVFYFSASVSVLLWLVVLGVTFGAVLLVLPLIAFVGWVAGLFFKAMFYGNAVRITPRQHPEISALVSETASALGIRNLPDVFIYNSGGLMNALAIRFVGKSHVVLFSALVDNMLLRGARTELKSIIAHELGHHAAGHTSPWKSLLLMPINFIPFLSNFYSRCCEYTCDRISYAVVRDKEAVQRSLLTLAHGTQSLADKSDLAEFCAQEREIPGLVGFYLEVLATHPRITRRITAIESFASAYTV